MRSIGLDIHRDFCEVAIAEAGEIRSAGRIEMTPEELELFAQSLGPRRPGGARGHRQRLGGRADHPAPRRRGWSSSRPTDTGIRQARAKTDRLDARALAKLLAAGAARRGLGPRRADPGDAPAAAAPKPAGPGATAGQERDPRGADAAADRRAAVHATSSGSRAGAGSPSSSCRPRSARPSTAACARSSSCDAEIAAIERVIAAEALGSAGDPPADDASRG